MPWMPQSSPLPCTSVPCATPPSTGSGCTTEGCHATHAELSLEGCVQRVISPSARREKTAKCPTLTGCPARPVGTRSVSGMFFCCTTESFKTKIGLG